jgi:hypothetical protein
MTTSFISPGTPKAPRRKFLNEADFCQNADA